MENGFIKLYRSLLKWEWIDNPNVLSVFIHCLLLANWEDKKWHGKVIERGEFITSIEKLSTYTGLSIQQTRTALNKLNESGELVTKTQRGRKYTIIRVCNYDNYQEQQRDNKEITTKQQRDNKEITTKQQRDNNEITTTKEYKNIKKDKKDKNNKNDKKSTPTRYRYGEFQKVLLSDDELDKLKQEYGTGTTDACITFLDEYIEMKGYKAKNHYLCIRKWVVDAVNERKAKKPQSRNDWIDDWLEQVKEGADEN